MNKKTQKKPADQRVVFLDFEFNGTKEENVNLVSCVTRDDEKKVTKKFWLHRSSKNQELLRKHLMNFDIVIGYSCVAEARSYLSLNLDPLYFNWIDLFLEYRMLTNHNDALNWGQQLVNGQVKQVHKPRPKWQRTEEDSMMGFRPTHSLAEATFKLTGKKRDTEHKTATRDLIISAPERFTDEERKQILDYNAEDVEFLPTIWKRIKEEYISLVHEDDLDMDEYFQEAMVRGRYSAHTAIMESIGYPINVEATRNFSRKIPSIITECQRDINSQFITKNKVEIVRKRLTGKDSIEDLIPFKWKPKLATYSWNQKVTREWITNNVDTSEWMKTDKGQLSLALEAFERFFPFKHDYPRENFGAQIVRYLKLKQSLTGFSETNKKKSFWDHVGSDGRVRPYMNIYGAQSGRSQPGATGFMFLKPAWMRALVEPKPGRFIASIDYGQQEFFLSGLESNDQTMIEAYLSGDPYLFGAKLAGAIPQDGTKLTHNIERDLFKNTYLGILFGMTKFGLSIKLTNDMGREVTEDEAQEQINIFEDTFPVYMDWRHEMLSNYHNGIAVRIPDGWTMWSDNENDRSVLNCPIQGLGAAVMRKAVDLAVARGCKIIFTLHDANYIEDEVGNEGKILILRDAMREAFQFYYTGSDKYELAAKIKMDPYAWSPDYEKDSVLKIRGGRGVEGWDVECSNLYIDSRAIPEYERFSKYFKKPDTNLL